MSAKHTNGRLNNKYLKQQHDIMLSFGYRLAGWSHRSGGHPRYDRDGYERLELASTPRSEKAARARLLRELRRRHPEHSRWRSAQKSRRHVLRATSDRRLGRALRHLNTVPDTQQPEPVPAPEPPKPVRVFAPSDPICDERRAAWRRNAEELARLNAEERLRPRRAA